MEFKGLSSAEVEKSRQEYGSNKLSETAGETFFEKTRTRFLLWARLRILSGESTL